MYIKELEKYAIKPYFYIGDTDWTKIKETYEKDDIKETLAEILMKYDPPYMDIDIGEAEKDFYGLERFTYKQLQVFLNHLK